MYSLGDVSNMKVFTLNSPLKAFVVIVNSPIQVLLNAVYRQ